MCPQRHSLHLISTRLPLYRSSGILAADVKMFFCKYNDPVYVKLEVAAALPLASRKRCRYQRLPSYGFWCLVFSGPRIPLCTTDALWGGVTHTFGQMSKHVGSVMGVTELCKGVWIPGPENPKPLTMKTTTSHKGEMLPLAFSTCRSYGVAARRCLGLRTYHGPRLSSREKRQNHLHSMMVVAAATWHTHNTACRSSDTATVCSSLVVMCFGDVQAREHAILTIFAD